MESSCAPMAFISCRMIVQMRSMTRHPKGRYTYMPEANCRTKPPRTMSLWLTASASAGSSFTVGMNRAVARIRSSSDDDGWRVARSPRAVKSV
jgi:hypothetical protein